MLWPEVCYNTVEIIASVWMISDMQILRDINKIWKENTAECRLHKNENVVCPYNVTWCHLNES